MKNYELLDLIGDANEDYVLAAEDGEVRPRLRPWAAGLAACAALALCIYPIYRITRPDSVDCFADNASAGGISEGSAPAQGGISEDSAPDQDAPLALHLYTVVEGGTGGVYDALFTAGDASDSTGTTNQADPATDKEAAYDAEYEERNEEAAIAAYPEDVYDDAVAAPEPPVASEAPVPQPEKPNFFPVDQDVAIMQYQRLYDACGLEDSPPEWYAGAWLDNNYPDRVARLAVSIVDGYHTPGLEAQIEEWCGGEVVFVRDMKYPYARLKSMLDQVNTAWMDPGREEAWAGFNTMSIRITDNCLEISFCGLPSDAALEFLARLDPEGDAIRVLVFKGPIVVTDDELFGEEYDAVSQADG